MVSEALAVLALLAASSPAASCGPVPPAVAGDRDAMIAAVQEARAAAGLAPFAVEERLCAVAQERAEELAAAGSVDSEAKTIPRVTRRLFAEGYRAHSWTERAILGWDPAAKMLSTWRRSGDSTWGQTVLGEYEELGVGVAAGDDGTTLALLFAVPRSSHVRVMARPLEDLAEVRALALRRVNEARAAGGLPPVTVDATLDAAAQRQAEDMLHRAYYSHLSPEGSTPGERATGAGYGPIGFLAENIAKGLFTPTEVVDRWMGSRDHRRNILHRQSAETGLGVAFGDTLEGFTVLWVQLFGRRR